MNLWYSLVELLPFEWAAPGSMYFMKNALLALLVVSPLFGILSTMVVTRRMSFFSDALGHSAFTGVAIGTICGMAEPLWGAVIFAALLALLFTVIRRRTSLASDTVIGVFSSTAVALGIFIATFDGGSFTKYNRYLIGDILSITPGQIGLLGIVLLCTAAYWVFCSNKLTLASVYPQLASSRGINVPLIQASFTAFIAVVVTLSVSCVGLLILNSLLVLPGAAARNISKSLRQYHLFSILFALIAGISGLILSYFLGASSGAAISLVLALIFGISFLFRKVRG